MVCKQKFYDLSGIVAIILSDKPKDYQTGQKIQEEAALKEGQIYGTMGVGGAGVRTAVTVAKAAPKVIEFVESVQNKVDKTLGAITPEGVVLPVPVTAEGAVPMPSITGIEAEAGILALSRKNDGKGSTHIAEKSAGEVEKPRVTATRDDANRYLQGLQDMKVLSEKQITKDNREYYMFTEKCEYRGIQFKKGQFIERDTQHHEWEFFQNEDVHLGAIDPMSGKLYKKGKRGRILKIGNLFF